MQNSSSRNIIGIFLIIIGGVWLASTLNLFIFEFDFWAYFWPVLLLALGLSMFIRGRGGFFSVLLIFIGGILLFSQIWDTSFEYLFDNYWPLLLIAFGLTLIFRRRDHYHYSRRKHKEYSFNITPEADKAPDANKSTHEFKVDDKGYTGTYSGAYGGNSNKGTYSGSYSGNFGSSYYNNVDTDTIDEVLILTSCRKVVVSQNFKGGKVTAILGRGVIDLSGAKLADGDNVIELTAIMGGITFKMPSDWKVIHNVVSVFGGFEDKRHYYGKVVDTAGNSVLIIRGTVIMGGSTITY